MTGKEFRTLTDPIVRVEVATVKMSVTDDGDDAIGSGANRWVTTCVVEITSSDPLTPDECTSILDRPRVDTDTLGVVSFHGE